MRARIVCLFLFASIPFGYAHDDELEIEDLKRLIETIDRQTGQLVAKHGDTISSNITLGAQRKILKKAIVRDYTSVEQVVNSALELVDRHAISDCASNDACKSAEMKAALKKSRLKRLQQSMKRMWGWLKGGGLKTLPPRFVSFVRGLALQSTVGYARFGLLMPIVFVALEVTEHTIFQVHGFCKIVMALSAGLTKTINFNTRVAMSFKEGVDHQVKVGYLKFRQNFFLKRVFELAAIKYVKEFSPKDEEKKASLFGKLGQKLVKVYKKGFGPSLLERQMKIRVDARKLVGHEQGGKVVAIASGPSSVWEKRSKIEKMGIVDQWIETLSFRLQLQQDFFLELRQHVDESTEALGLNMNKAFIKKHMFKMMRKLGKTYKALDKAKVRLSFMIEKGVDEETFNQIYHAYNETFNKVAMELQNFFIKPAIGTSDTTKIAKMRFDRLDELNGVLAKISSKADQVDVVLELKHCLLRKAS